jgi:hypothetical protein
VTFSSNEPLGSPDLFFADAGSWAKGLVS